MGYTTSYIRERYNLTQKDIAEYWDIPLRTVENWDHRSTMPRYVSNLMNDTLLQMGFYIETWELHLNGKHLSQIEIDKLVSERIKNKKPSPWKKSSPTFTE